MKWTKPSRATIGYFERLAPGPPLETRKMFGMPCRFLNGHMLVGVFQNTLMLHLGAADRARCIRAGAKPFKPMGREMKEYVEIKPGLFEDRELKEWIVCGMRYLASLAPKGKRNVLPEKRSAKTKRAKPKAAKSAKRSTRRAATKATRRRQTKPAPKKAASKKVARKTKRSPARRTARKRYISGPNRRSGVL